MMKIVFVWTMILSAAIVAGAAPAPPSPFETSYTLTGANPIDKLVLEKLNELNIKPANVCSNAVFVRRAYLDIIGTIPTLQQARAFIVDKNPAKRKKLIDRLLEREEFADYWAMKWGDLLRVKAEFPINLWPNGVQVYHRWIRESVKANMPYDQFVREMLTASGSNFRVPPVNFYRALQSNEPESIAKAVALTFMGMRVQHWEKERLEGLAAFFSQVSYKATGEWKEEIIRYDAEKALVSVGSGSVPMGVFPDKSRARLYPGEDPREVFAKWLIDPKNPWFTKNISNRVWSWLLGRGIIHEPDDIRPDNPASNPKLLAYLEKELAGANYDLKHLFRLILNSRTYQLSSIPKSDKPEAAANFAYYPIRRLEAEVLVDALCQITWTTEKYSSAIPEPFTFIPEEQRSIALSDGSITSPFLDLFGRPSRDTGLESERNNNPSAAQSLHMLNSSHIQKKIERTTKFKAFIQSKQQNPRQVVTALYLTILSRFPTEKELKIVLTYSPPLAGKSSKSREVGKDLAWALLNSAEFLYRH